MLYPSKKRREDSSRNRLVLHQQVLLPFLALALVSSVPTTTAQGSSYWCDAVLGCLTLTSEWTSLQYRPNNPTPFTRDQIATSFTLHTRSSNLTPGTPIYANSSSSITSSTFNATKPIKVLIHGYTQNGDEADYVTLTNSLLAYGDYNVIRTHWPGGSQTDYLHAMVNTRVVGLEIALLINTLVTNFSVNASNVHIIGHSLGGHTAGYAGSGIPNCGKITGLDPAGPFFSNMPAVVVLDPTDAQLVEAIHTNAGAASYFGFGTVMPMGHLDFYPNGGDEQNGCDPISAVPPANWWDIPNWGVNLAFCSHGRSVTLYADSWASARPQVAYECADYNTFLAGGCSSCGSGNLNCAQFGPSSSSYPSRSRTFVKLYFRTSNAAPFGMYHYQLKTVVGGSQTVSGYIKFGIGGGSGSVPSTDLFNPPSFPGNILSPGTVLNGLVTSTTNVGVVASTTLTFSRTGCVPAWGADCSLRVSSVTVSPLNNWPESSRAASAKTLCAASPPAVIVDGGSTTLGSSCPSG